jgi:hypothetical protein
MIAIRTYLCIAALLPGWSALLMAQESADKTAHDATPVSAPGADTAPALDPQPRTVPAPPGVVSASAARSTTDALLERIERAVIERDRGISTAVQQGIVAPASGATPDEIPGAPPAESETLLKEHADARRVLRSALEQAVSRGIRPASDVLDRGSPRAKAAQVGPLQAANRLAIAECWKDLATAPDGSSTGMGDLDQGLAALGSIDPIALDAAQQIRRSYLTLWFRTEYLRRLPGDAPAADKTRLLAEARTAQQELAASAPGSPLAAAGEALFIGLVPAAGPQP